MALVSSTIRCRRVSNLEAAPEKVNAISSPSRAKTDPSTAPKLSNAPSASFALRRIPIRRPTSRSSIMPRNKPKPNNKPRSVYFISDSPVNRVSSQFVLLRRPWIRGH